MGYLHSGFFYGFGGTQIIGGVIADRSFAPQFCSSLAFLFGVPCSLFLAPFSSSSFSCFFLFFVFFFVLLSLAVHDDHELLQVWGETFSLYRGVRYVPLLARHAISCTIPSCASVDSSAHGLIGGSAGEITTVTFE